jgi:hypothetical protein
VSDYKISVTLAGRDDASDEINKVNRELNQLGQVSGTSAGQVNVLGGAMSALGAAVSIGAFVDVTKELNEIGVTSGIAKEKFNQLVSTTSDTADMLERLQGVTRRNVDDFTLMDSSAQMMAMGIASSGAELEKFTELAVNLRRPTMSAAEALDNFTLMMANQSVLRLDSFGISGAAVQARMDELTESLGMTREAAFKLATLEIGQQSLERLGDAAFAADTSLARVTTRVENLRAEIGEFVAQGLEAGAMVIEIGIIYTEQAIAQNDLIVQAEQNADDYVNAFERSLGEKIINPYAAAIVVEATLADDGAGIYRSLEQIFFDATRDFSASEQAQLGIQFSAFSADEAGQLEMMQSYLLAEAAARNMAESARAEGEARQRQQEIFEQNREAITAMAEETERQEAANALNAESMQLMAGLTDYISEQFITLNGIEIIPSEEAERAREMADRLAEMVDVAESFGIDTSDLSEAAREAEAIATQAERAKDAFDNMSLDSLLGAGDGGRAGEFADMILQQMQEQGMSEEAIAASRQALMLGSGQATGGTVAIEGLSEILAGLAPEEQTQAMTNLTGALDRLALEGISLSDLTAEQVQGLAGLTGGAGEAVLVEYGDTLTSIAQELKTSVDTLVAQNGIEDPNRIFAGQELMTGEGFGVGALDPVAFEEIKQSLIDSNVEVATMNETLGAIVAPDLGPETLQLMASYDTAKGISNQMAELTSREHRIKVVYEVSTVGGSAPSGAPSLPTAVPVSSSQVSRR